ncbi:MAG: hypothetical protein ABJD13_04440 [Paracoccaceae bacterium]
MARSVRHFPIPDVDIDHDPREPALAQAVCEQKIVCLDVGGERSGFWPIRLLYKHAQRVLQGVKEKPALQRDWGRIKISSKRFERGLD